MPFIGIEGTLGACSGHRGSLLSIMSFGGPLLPGVARAPGANVAGLTETCWSCAGAAFAVVARGTGDTVRWPLANLVRVVSTS